MQTLPELEQWIDEYGQKLFDRACYLLSVPEDAEDLVQDVFVAAFSQRSNFKANSSRLTWLMGILHNKIADFYKNKYKKGTQISLDYFFDENHLWQDPESILKDWDLNNPNLLDDESFLNYLEACLEALPNKWMTLVKLTYLHEKKSKEICQETNVSVTNYWKILQRSRLQLRECLQANWFE